jgi:hypothetical protein
MDTFDVRTLEDGGCACTSKGDLGFAKAFTTSLAMKIVIHAMRLFIGQPFGRLLIVPGGHESRQK